MLISDTYKTDDPLRLNKAFFSYLYYSLVCFFTYYCIYMERMILLRDLKFCWIQIWN